MSAESGENATGTVVPITNEHDAAVEYWESETKRLRTERDELKQDVEAALEKADQFMGERDQAIKELAAERQVRQREGQLAVMYKTGFEKEVEKANALAYLALEVAELRKQSGVRSQESGVR